MMQVRVTIKKGRHDPFFFSIGLVYSPSFKQPALNRRPKGVC